MHCISLKNIIILENVTIIGSSAFSYCTSITSITIPGNVTFIGYNAFDHCTSLKSITIPKKVTTIQNEVFSDCYNLSKITFLDNNNTITISSNIFYHIDYPINIYIPGHFNISSDYNNQFPNRSHLYITSETILSESCKDFFGEKSVYVHIEGRTKIPDEKTTEVIDFIAIPQIYLTAKANYLYPQIKCSHIISLFPIIK